MPADINAWAGSAGMAAWIQGWPKVVAVGHQGFGDDVDVYTNDLDHSMVWITHIDGWVPLGDNRKFQWAVHDPFLGTHTIFWSVNSTDTAGESEHWRGMVGILGFQSLTLFTDASTTLDYVVTGLLLPDVPGVGGF